MNLPELITNTLPSIAEWLWRASWQAGVVVVLVLVTQRVFRRVLTPRWRHALWFLVLARLIIPAWPASSVSVFNLLGFSLPGDGQSAAQLVENSKNLRWIHSEHFGVGQNADPFSDVDADRISVGGGSTWVGRPRGSLYVVATVAALVCLAGFGGIVVWAYLANARFWRQARTSSEKTDPRLLRIFDGCCREIGLPTKRAPAVLVTSATASPALGGLLRPCILVPAHLPAELDDHQIRMVLLHELTHFVCGDLWMNCAWTLVHALHWFNPLLWMAESRCAADRELARDAMVLQHVGAASAREYGDALIRVVELGMGGGGYRGIVAMAQGGARIQERIVMIAGFESRSIWRNVPGIVLMFLTGCVALTGPKSARYSSSPAALAGTMPSLVVSSTEPSLSLRDQVVEEALSRVIPELDFSQNKPPLDVAIETISDAAGVNILLQRDALAAAKFDIYATVGRHFYKRTLRYILDTLARSDGPNPVTYTIKNGTIVITTAREMDKNVIVKVYGVRDLVVDSKVTQTSRDVTDQNLNQLKKSVEKLVAFDSWKDNDANAYGQINIADDSLIVTATAEVQGEVLQLLSQLRQTRNVSIEVVARFVTTGSSQSQADQFLTRKLRPDAGKPAQNAVMLPLQSLNELVGIIEKDKDAKLFAAPRMTLVNGELAHMVDETTLPYVASVRKQPSGKDFIYTPTIAKAHDGVELDIRRVVVSADRKSTLVDFAATATEFLGFTPGVDAADSEIKYQVPMNAIYSYDTRIMLGNDQVLLLALAKMADGGRDGRRNAATRSGEGIGAGHVERRTYLLLQARVVLGK
ncbi:MAG: hypothetical protein M3O30_18460 [Planctomycetota bacterium]|nr:hypothetical protein [Planctomycetota bacterium]